MAQTLRRPFLYAVTLNSIGPAVEQRCFSIAAQRWASPRQPQAQQPAMRKERSIRVASKLSGKLVGDLGLLESEATQDEPVRHLQV